MLVVLGIIFLPMILNKPAPDKPQADIRDFELTPARRLRPIKPEPPASSIPDEIISRYEQKAINKETPKVETAKKEIVASLPKTGKEKPRKKPDKETESKVKTGAAKGQWVIQMGSFSKKDNAQRLVREIKGMGYPGYLEEVTTNGKIIFRVRTGPFASKTRVDEIKQLLDQKLELKTLIVKLQ